MTAIQDHMTYIVIEATRFGRTTYIAERDVCDMDRATTIRDIADAQYDRLAQVIEINPVEGTCRDVTEDIAREVMTVFASQGEPLSRWQRDFVEQHVGMQAAASFPMEAA